jgi:hypothetical protein
MYNVEKHPTHGTVTAYIKKNIGITGLFCPKNYSVESLRRTLKDIAFRGKSSVDTLPTVHVTAPKIRQV